MPDLTHSLQGRDLGFLRIISLLWGFELNAPDVHTALPQVVDCILDSQAVAEVVETLPPDAQTALASLLQSEGKLPWAVFTRQFGSVRDMGAGRRDRERPYLSPISPAEVLWYRALIGRDFLDTTAEPLEFAYIPDDLIPLLPISEINYDSPPGRPASPGECTHLQLANDNILNLACTLLAALRIGHKIEQDAWGSDNPSPDVLKHFITDAGLIDVQDIPIPEPTRAFLEASRGEALVMLAKPWLDSDRVNELRWLPGLKFEGEWFNDPKHTRNFLTDLLSTLPQGTWWNLTSLVNSIRERHPDFQRPAGDYDSWYIRREGSEEYLRGFTHWDDIDGALIRYLITGPMHWMGLVDLAGSSPSSLPTAFRLSDWAPALMDGQSPEGLASEDGTLQVSPKGELLVSRLAPRSLRYQVARFSHWDEETEQEYRYHLTPTSLQRARSQNLRVSHLLLLLRRYTSTPVPPNLVQALERWDTSGTQARLEQVLVLRLTSPDVLAALRRSKAARFLGDPLGPTAVIVKPGALKKVLVILAEMGYLTEVEFEG